MLGEEDVTTTCFHNRKPSSLRKALITLGARAVEIQVPWQYSSVTGTDNFIPIAKACLEADHPTYSYGWPTYRTHLVLSDALATGPLVSRR